MDDKLVDIVIGVVHSVIGFVKKGVSVLLCFSMIIAVREEMLVASAVTESLVFSVSCSPIKIFMSLNDGGVWALSTICIFCFCKGFIGMKTRD